MPHHSTSKSALTQEELHQLLDYDPETGVFRWKVNSGYCRAGQVTAFPTDRGYLRISIQGKIYSVHRLAWFYVHGVWPTQQVDHINGVKTDNRICNLREATNSENNQGRRMRSDNTSGYVGVTWNKSSKKFRAQIKVNGRYVFLGKFATAEEASRRYLQAKAELHTFHPTPLRS